MFDLVPTIMYGVTDVSVMEKCRIGFNRLRKNLINISILSCMEFRKELFLEMK